MHELFIVSMRNGSELTPLETFPVMFRDWIDQWFEQLAIATVRLT